MKSNHTFKRRKTGTILSISACILAASNLAHGANVWVVDIGNNSGASGTVTDDALPGFSADFTITRTNVVGFGDATWSGGNNLNLANQADNSNEDPDGVTMTISFSNVTGGAISSIISEFGNDTNNDLDSTWTYTFSGGGNAVLSDPDNQMNELDGFSFASGGSVSTATDELPAGSSTWSVGIPDDSVTLEWSSLNNAFAEEMAFRVAAVPEPSSLFFVASSSLMLLNRRRRN